MSVLVWCIFEGVLMVNAVFWLWKVWIDVGSWKVAGQGGFDR
jgi:hypothetical protein